jgi:dienelactone hydrolase
MLLLLLLVARSTQAESVEPEQLWIPTTESSVFGAAREVRLEATLYRPAGDGPFPVLLFNHGSTGNGRIAPTLTVRYTAVAQFFVERGFVVLMPMRRGRGASGGQYGEAYGCDPAVLSQGVERGTADVEAALTFALKQTWADPTRLVIGGMSRGGLLSVLYPSVRQVNARGVINFAGGWTFDACDARARFNEQMFGRAGRAKLPMLWLYAENDRNYGPASIRGYHRAFTKAGGSAELRMFPPIGHDGHDLLPRSGAVWQQAVEEFLTRIGLPAPAR